MPELAIPMPPPAASVSAIAREVRRHRIMERVDRGWSRKSIAQAEDLTPRRVGQIVQATLARRGRDPAGEHRRRQSARLDPSLRLAARKIADGDLAGIDRLLRVLDRLDRYQTAAAAAPRDRPDDAARRDAGRDRRVKSAAGRRARDAAAPAADPARASICLQPSDFAQSGEKKTSENFKTERILRPRPPARRPVARAAACARGCEER
ncbi:MAG: hypothetical protein ABR970_21240 [Roseiarcus sp.]